MLVQRGARARPPDVAAGDRARTHDRDEIAAGNAHGVVAIWNYKTGELRRILFVGNGNSDIMNLAYSKHSDRLAVSAYGFEEICFFNPNNGELTARLPTTNHSAIALSPDGSWLYLATTGGPPMQRFAVAADGSLRETLSGQHPGPMEMLPLMRQPPASAGITGRVDAAAAMRRSSASIPLSEPRRADERRDNDWAVLRQLLPYLWQWRGRGNRAVRGGGRGGHGFKKKRGRVSGLPSCAKIHGSGVLGCCSAAVGGSVPMLPWCRVSSPICIA